MAAKAKVQAKSAGSSPAQTSKLQVLTAPPIPQPEAEKHLTLQDLQGVIETLEKNLERKITTQITTQIKETEAKIQSELTELQEKVQNNNIAIRQDIVFAFRGVWDYTQQIEERVGGLEQEKEKNDETIQELRQADQREAILRQYNEMLWAVRIRGLKENKQTQEDLTEIFANALADFTGETSNECRWQIDKIYRVNSWIARQKNLPRDIVIYFVTRRIRNMVTTLSYNKKLVVEGQEVTIMKEIPSGMIKLRRGYAFLVEELKKREILFRWEAPEGVTVNLQGKRYRLTSIWKAKDFYTNVLEAGRPPSPKGQEDTDMGEKEKEKEKELSFLSRAQMKTPTVREEELKDKAEGGVERDIFQPFQMEIPQKQILTRAVTKRIEQEVKSKSKQCSQEMLAIEEQAVGGARPKSTQESLDTVLQRLAGTDHVK